MPKHKQNIVNKNRDEINEVRSPTQVIIETKMATM